MIPVAGRRKGQAPPPAVHQPPPPIAPSGREPDWLFTESVVPAAGGPATTPAPFSVPTVSDALSFLDFEDEQHAPAAASYVTASPTTSTATATTAAAAPTHVAPSPVSLLGRHESLRNDLQGTQRDLVSCEARIKLLEGGEDDLCQELRRLESNVCEKQEEVGRAAVIQLELEESLQLWRKWVQGGLRSCHQQDLVNAANALQSLCESDVKRLKTLLEEQAASLRATQERHSAMDGSIDTTEPYERVLTQLQEKLKKSVHEMSNSICVRVKPCLVGSIRETIVESAQQRLDILSNDRQRRWDEWQLFQKNMKEKFHRFQEERRLKHRAGFDSALAHAATKFRTALDNRLTASTQSFAERQRTVIVETHQGTQRAIDEMIKRFREDLNTMENKQSEELKRIVHQCAAELAHHARLYTAEREAAVRRQRQCAEEEQIDEAGSIAYKSVENKLNFLEAQLEQLRQSVLFDIHEVTSVSSSFRGETFPLREKALVLQECERNTRQLGEQIGTQWQRFKAAVAPLEQCISSMAAGLQEGRVKVATMQQGAESVYQAWSQDVRRELSRCLTSNGISSNSEEVRSGVECMTQVMEGLLLQLHPLRVAHSEGRARQRCFRTSMEQEIGALDTQRCNCNNALNAVFDVYDRLSRVEAELEAKRKTLEVAESDYAAVRQQLEEERAAFGVRLREAEQLGAELRHNAAIWGKPSAFGESMKNSLQTLRDVTSEDACRDNVSRAKSSGLHQLRRQQRQEQHTALLDETLIHSQERPAEEENVSHCGRAESVKDFLTVDNPCLPLSTSSGPYMHECRRQSRDSGYEPSSEGMRRAGSTRSLTTPSTSNS
ncbi:hypothetical protein TraAM80_04450 [Trypanosoma rangeli]|uniref:L6202.3-like protein n=1 Tax=Trypanosoma rangeli TaxID=5698 RepID=A0A422NJ59_TRYRA|nr:uncharacterized protein TraAM80_04450 [Trypanosoma rangeli]RNF05528.1 hypothetical protein TraAM80_04450 [Trypanosoma rangeli]|eukprot:RNF05528.1 hypothetical protein TraAM80_04450 [Trypanosoma rangeli]